MVRILLADDHALIREGMKRLLSLDKKFQVVKEAATGPEIWDAVQQGGIDIAVLDLNMPGVNGMDHILHIHSRYATLPILVLSMHGDVHMARCAIRAGASGYVVKNAAPETLLAAVDYVAKGERFIDPGIAEHMLFDIELSTGKSPYEILSDREFNIIRMLAMGKSMNQIASKLAISNKTVSTYKARVMAKLELRSDGELIRYALLHELAK